MLNPELKKDLDIEIQKSEPLLREFLTGDYFRETLEMVFKVNRLNEEQKESVELEVILYILGMSNYENIEEAIKEECTIETGATARQLNDDINKYILDKIKAKTVEVKKSLEEIKRVELKTSENEVSEIVATEKLMFPNVKNLLDENFDIKNPRDLVKNIIIKGEEKATTTAQEIENGVLIKEESNVSVQEERKLGDVYRERLDESDAIIKKEI